MAEQSAGTGSAVLDDALASANCCQTRKDRRKTVKKLKRKQLRREAAIREKEEEEARLADPEELRRLRLREEEEAEIAERERAVFEERERQWLEAAAARKAAEEEEQRKKLLEKAQEQKENELDEDNEWDYIEEGPAEIIWQGNEIIVKKKRVKVAKGTCKKQPEEDDNRPTSNPLPPQSVAFASYMDGSSVSAQEVLEKVAQEVPNFGTEQDKAHCPFHLKTGACRFGSRCSRVHFHPDKSCTLLIKNMYNGPGLSWEQDEGLEYTDEEVDHCYEEFYEDVHTEFLKFGELVNFKVCNNGSYHLRGNVYVHYKSLDSAVLAYNNINGRYFAGKQMTCEFVSVTRWKVAICGEYMKSKFKTCSHGTACNFIHCFRNPGGDYEWADWDNPPPKYWIKRMIALFGTSTECQYDKLVDYRESERFRRSDRTPSKKRFHSRRSDSGGSPTKESDTTRDPYSHSSIRREQFSSRREEYAALTEKHDRDRGHGKFVKSGRTRNCDSAEGNYKENNRVSLKNHHKYEDNYYDDQERHKMKHKEYSLRRKRGKNYSIEYAENKSRFHEKGDVQSSDYTDDDRQFSDDQSTSLSGEKSSHKDTFDEERYNGRPSMDEEHYEGIGPEDLGSNTQHSECPAKRADYNKYRSSRSDLHSDNRKRKHESSSRKRTHYHQKDDNGDSSCEELSNLECGHEESGRGKHQRNMSRHTSDGSSRKRRHYHQKDDNHDSSSEELSNLEYGHQELGKGKHRRDTNRHASSQRREIG
ncbi:zinc finger CCCH domain-containing protein 16 [Zingiber officinale]|uniref:zinc finger CCCH domain-containing protein 16 n=1 Tax=Zingiber officinale TaxID=94328 RepID=UPI001C4D24DA|nr:zinc finger CCCH domain-containing protein 16 [Zingiber officinale]